MTTDAGDGPRGVLRSLARRGWEQRWAISIAVLAALLIALTVTVRTSELLPGEQSATRWLADHAGSPGRGVAKVLGVAADDEMAPFLFIAMALLIWRGYGRLAMLTFAWGGGLTAVVSVIDLASRPRPGPDFTFGDIVHGKGGYPSGHTIYGVLVIGMAAFLVHRYAARSRLRAALVWALAAVVVLMGPSRVVEQAHWPADVTGGYLIGFTLLLGTIWLHDRVPAWIAPRFPRLHRLATGAPRTSPSEGASE